MTFTFEITNIDACQIIDTENIQFKYISFNAQIKVSALWSLGIINKEISSSQKNAW